MTRISSKRSCWRGSIMLAASYSQRLLKASTTAALSAVHSSRSLRPPGSKAGSLKGPMLAISRSTRPFEMHAFASSVARPVLPIKQRVSPSLQSLERPFLRYALSPQADAHVRLPYPRQSFETLLVAEVACTSGNIRPQPLLVSARHPSILWHRLGWSLGGDTYSG